MGAWGWDIAGKLSLWQPQAKAIFGLSPQTEMTQELFSSLIHPDDAPRHHAAWATATALDGPHDYALTFRILRAGDGAERWIGANAVADFNGDLLVRVFGALRDITEERVRQSDAEVSHLAAIVASSSDAILSKTLDGTITSWNDGASRMFGYGADEIIGKPITLIIPPDRIAEEMEILARIGADDRIAHYETVRVAKDGQRLDVSLTISPLKDASGNVIGASKIIRDISERKRSESDLRRLDAALRKSHVRMLQAADAAGLTYFDIDLATGHLEVAENYAQVMGYEPEGEIESRQPLANAVFNLFSHMDPADRPQVEAAFSHFLAGGPTEKVEYRVRGDDGIVRWFSATWTGEVASNGQPAQIFATRLDISRLVEGIDALAAAKAEAERANQAKSKFLATASHDLRQPVQSLVLLLSLAERQVNGESKATKTVKMMKAAVDGLHGLLSAVLDVSRLDAGVVALELENIALGALLSRLASEYEAKAASKKLRLRRVARRLSARSDPALLERALRNLIENAIRYTPKGSILLGLRRRGALVRIDVIDTGIGIPDDKHKEIFSEFNQLDDPGREQGEGLGLGLAIVARLAELLGAKIEVASTVGRGSRFSLSLPFEEMEPPEQKSQAMLVDPGGRVLIIEDNFIIRLSLEAMLNDWGYETFTVGCGEDAIELAAIEGWLFDIIVADHTLGTGLTGVATAREISDRADRTFPTLVLTGDTAKERIAEITASGFEVLHKPVSAEDLRRKLAELRAA